MEKRQELVDRWKEKLRVGEEMLHSGPLRVKWLGEVYVRVYRFLLSTYGSKGWRSDKESPIAETSESNPKTSGMPLVDCREDFSGAPAKTIETLRNFLTRVSEGNQLRPTQIAPAPDSERWVMVVTFNGRLSHEKCVMLLCRNDIVYSTIRNGSDFALAVPYAYREKAFELLEKNRESLQMHPQTAPEISVRTTRIGKMSKAEVVIFLLVILFCVGIVITLVITHLGKT